MQDLVDKREGRHRAAGIPAGCCVLLEVLNFQFEQLLSRDGGHAREQVEGLGAVLVAAAPPLGLAPQPGEHLSLVVAPVGVVDPEQAADAQPRVGRLERAEHDQRAETSGEPASLGLSQPWRAPLIPNGVGAAQQPSQRSCQVSPGNCPSQSRTRAIARFCRDRC